ncbi:hypothetical protein MPSEU_001044400 [Mayamaea pseudoterrestris]|nr:hypothetical protein MPSEU_001044400 [Mayamaea pseudoterrestris]
MAHQATADRQPVGDEEASANHRSEDESNRSNRWDSSCKGHRMSTDLYLELLKGPLRRQVRVGASENRSTSNPGFAKTASDEEWTEATASESFSSSLSSIGLPAMATSPYPADYWNSPGQPRSITMGGPSARPHIPSVHQLLEQTFPFLDSDKDEEDIGAVAIPVAGTGLRTLIEDEEEEEDATSSSRQEDSFHHTDDEFELILPTNNAHQTVELHRSFQEKESFSDSSDNGSYFRDESGSYDDYSGSEYMSDDNFMMEYVTSSEDEGDEDIYLLSNFHVPLTSIASIDKLPTRTSGRSHTPSMPASRADTASTSSTYEQKAATAIGTIGMDKVCSAADETAMQVGLLALSVSDVEVNLSCRQSTVNDSYDSLPKLPYRQTTSEFSKDDASAGVTATTRQVRFAPTCKIQEYAVTVGDNPSCSGACALTLDWEHTQAYQQVHGQIRSNSGALKCLSQSSRRERVMAVQGLTQQKLRLLELQVHNRVTRNALLAKTKRKQRSGRTSTGDASLACIKPAEGCL